jgi:hypothetical protein
MTRSRKAQGKVTRGEVSWEGATTVMIRNVSPKVTQSALRAELHARGFGVPHYDFFYLPMNAEKNANAGYAFVNFCDVNIVAAFVQAFDSTTLPGFPSRRRLQVVPASTQGYEANLQHFAHSAVLNHHESDHAPLFLRDSAHKARGKARSRQAVQKPVRALAYNPGLQQPQGATVILRLTADAGGDGSVLDTFLSDVSPWAPLLCAGVDFQHVDAWGTGTATLHFRNEDLAFHFQRAFEHASLLVGAPPIELEVVNAKMPKMTAFEYTPQSRSQVLADSPQNRNPPNGPPPPPPLESVLGENGLSPTGTPMWLQAGDERKGMRKGSAQSPASAKSEATVRAVPLHFDSTGPRTPVAEKKSPNLTAALSPSRAPGSEKKTPGSPFDLPSLLPAPDGHSSIPPLPLA